MSLSSLISFVRGRASPQIVEDSRFASLSNSLNGRLTSCLKGLFCNPGMWESDPRVLAAKKEMSVVQLPSLAADVLDKELIDWLKALFSPLHNNDPTPGFGFGYLHINYKYTLESYWVDKHLSSRIATSFMEKAIPRIESAVHKQLYGTSNEKEVAFGRSSFFIGVVEDFGIRDDPDFSSKKAFSRESSFLISLIERLCLSIEPEIVQAIPLPPEINTKLFRDTAGPGDRCPAPHWMGFSQDPLLTIYRDYCNKIYNLRDQKVLAFLKKMWDKDQEARQVNPTAPLINLTTLPEYEQALADKISLFFQKQQRQIFLQKALIAVVFFCVIFLSIIYLSVTRGLIKNSST